MTMASRSERTDEHHGAPLRWRILQAIGAVLMAGAVVACTLGFTLAQHDPAAATLPSDFAILAAFGLVLGFVGLPLYLVGRVAASASRR